MKLYNLTKCPDEILKPLLVAAGRAIGARTGKVIVRVTQARTPRVGGTAFECVRVRDWNCRGLSSSNSKHQRWIETDGGSIEIRLPKTHPAFDLLGLAQQFFKTAMHEWAHILDFQTGGSWVHSHSRRGAGGKRPAWGKRPEEIRAQDMVYDAQQKIDKGKINRPDDFVIDLAVWMEGEA